MNGWGTGRKTQGSGRTKGSIMRLKAGMIASLALICCCALLVTELLAQTAGRKKDVATLSALSSSFQALAERVSPAVVQIMTTGYGALAGGPTSGDFVATQRGRGSGVILDRQGYKDIL